MASDPPTDPGLRTTLTPEASPVDAESPPVIALPPEADKTPRRAEGERTKPNPKKKEKSE